MKDHKIGGKFVEKFFGMDAEKDSLTIQFPENLQELRSTIKEGKLIVNGKEFPMTEEKVLAWAYRGFSLQHQGGGETLTEEEKAERKADRKIKADAMKTPEIQAMIAAAIAAKKAEAKA